MKDAVLKIVKDLRCLADDLESFAESAKEESADSKTKIYINRRCESSSCIKITRWNEKRS